jgi:tRNA nucleotidyltransferase/poly(A) polymerase
MRIERETANDVRRHAARLADVSPERVRDELFRLLALPRAAAALRAAVALGLIAPVLPELDLSGDGWTRGLRAVEYLAEIAASVSPGRSDNLTASFGMGMLVMQLNRFRHRLHMHFETAWPNGRSHQALLALATLFYAAGAQPLNIDRAAALRLSNNERDRATAIIGGTGALLTLDTNDRRVLHRFWHDAGAAGVDMCLLAAADYLACAGSALDQDSWLGAIEKVCALLDAFYNHYHEIVEPPVLIDGLVLMRTLGVPSGPAVGALLAAIREAQAAGEVQTADDALRLARALT